MALPKTRSIDAELHTAAAEAEEVPGKNKSLLQKMRIVFTNITVEPVFILYLLPCTMASLTTQNLSLEKACRVNLAFGDQICDGLVQRNTSKFNESHEVEVQKLVASMNAWKNIIQSLLPAILLMFVGSWSDRRQRRKPCIITPIVGEVLATLGFLFCTYFFYELPLIFNTLAEALPPALTGGWFLMFTAIFSHISTVSSVETRTVRIGAVNTVSNISYTIGIAISGILYSAIGFYGVFSLALCMYTIGIIYGCIAIKEMPVKDQNDEVTGVIGFLKDFFEVKHVLETLNVAFKTGEKNRRKRICVIMLLVVVVSGPMYGEYAVLYLFTRYRFKWNEVSFSAFETYSAITYTIGTIFSLSFFSKYLKMDDALLGVISSLSKVLSSIVYAFAPNPIVFCLGCIVEMLNGTSHIAMRSIISKLVPLEEIGKINSLFCVFDALVPLIYGPLYSIVYKSTINDLPSAFFLFGGILTLPAVFIFLWLYHEHKRDAKECIENEAQKEDLLKKENNTTI